MIAMVYTTALDYATVEDMGREQQPRREMYGTDAQYRAEPESLKQSDEDMGSHLCGYCFTADQQHTDACYQTVLERGRARVSTDYRTLKQIMGRSPSAEEVRGWRGMNGAQRESLKEQYASYTDSQQNGNLSNAN